MKVSQLSRNLFSGLLLAFFLFPYVSFLKFFNWNISISGSELVWVLKNSFLQAFTAAGICVVLGFYFSLGLFQLPEKSRSIVARLVLIPQILPTLFSILIAFSILNPFPVGHIGVIFIFVLVNLGFSVYQITQAVQNKMGQLALISEIYGLKKSIFRRRILIPIIWPDLRLNFLFVFLFCFSSLSVPLVAGGGKGTNLEVLIYEKIFIEQNWDSAWLLMLLQTLLVFCISYFLLKTRTYAQRDFRSHSYYNSRLAAVGLGVYIFGYLGYYLFSVIDAGAGLDDVLLYRQDILNATINSFVVLAGVTATCFLLLMLWISDYAQGLRHNIVVHFISVSTVMVGFAFYIFLPLSKRSDLIKIPLAFALLFFPILFRIFFAKRIEQLRSQIIAAKVFAVPLSRIAFDIVLKQLLKPLFFAAVLLMIWSLSDFAISRSVGTQSQTLGLISENFLTSYRLDAAFLISFYILLIWIFLTTALHFIFKGFYGANK